MERRRFTREFKLAAVKKVLEQGLTWREVAREFGIRDTYLHNWKNAFEKDGTLAAENGEKGSGLIDCRLVDVV